MFKKQITADLTYYGQTGQLSQDSVPLRAAEQLSVPILYTFPNPRDLERLWT